MKKDSIVFELVFETHRSCLSINFDDCIVAAIVIGCDYRRKNFHRSFNVFLWSVKIRRKKSIESYRSERSKRFQVRFNFWQVWMRTVRKVRGVCNSITRLIRASSVHQRGCDREEDRVELVGEETALRLSMARLHLLHRACHHNKLGSLYRIVSSAERVLSFLDYSSCYLSTYP